MARRVGTVAFAVLALSISLVAVSRAALSEARGAQFEAETVNEMHRHLMTSLKTAQESAGIFVDDAHLFTQPLNANGRRLQQTDAASAVLANPSILATLLSLVSQGFNVGSFPGAALNLPGGSAFGYQPTDDSYCLFATQPYSGPPEAKVGPGPLPAEGVPPTFGCVAASTNPPQGPGSFPITVGATAYICAGGAAPPPGRKLLQTPSPASSAIGNALTAIGLPIWNCVVATTPVGNTTLGDATLAVLNDLGVVAEHLLVYLNADGQLTYEEDVVNDFVSLTNPLWPTGPRLNFSIDFASLDKDHALFKEIFGKPSPASPPGISPVEPATPGAAPAATPQQAAGPQPQGNQGSQQAAPQDTAQATPPTDATATATAQPPAAPADTTTLTAFDGYLSNCQVVIGSIPHADGNFDRNNNFSTVIASGSVEMPLTTTNEYSGQVAYIIPASKATEYPALTAETAASAQFCNDIATLEPAYNPLATVINGGALDLSANPLTTTAVFGQAFGMSADALLQAFALTLPSNETLWGYDALGAAAGGDSAALAILKANVQVANLVTAGANTLTNDTTLYASFAIIMNQAIAKKVLYSPPLTGRRLLQAPAVDLTNATTLASIMTIAAQLVPTQSDSATVAALIQGLTPDQLTAVGLAVANLNTAVAAAPDADSVEKGTYYAQTELASQVNELATGTLSLQDFTGLTTSTAIGDAISKTSLPGAVVPAAATPPPTPSVVPQTQSTTGSTQSSPSSSSSSGSGLSHGGKVALATILPIFGVVAIVAVIAFVVTRRNRSTYEESNNSSVWWRRPFARSGAAPGPSTV